MHTYRLTQINIYPVKSLGGISLPSAYAGGRGLQYDRRWMLVDEFNSFITQRENPMMALIGLKMNEQGFQLFHKNTPQTVFTIPFALEKGKHCAVTIWNDVCDAIEYEHETNDWLREVLNQNCRLTYMPDTANRYVAESYSRDKDIVSFADGFPFLIIGEASLQNLNEKLTVLLPMNRFRPNFVFSGGSAFDEDSWGTCCIGDVEFHVVKPCIRCTITTIDQDTGARSHEPLRTLSTYRKENNNVYFGQNLLIKKQGIVRLNDVLTISPAK